MFEVDLGKIKFNWKGTYVNTDSYEPDDVVYYSGTTFICVNNVTGVAPTTSPNPFWNTMALGSDLGSVAANAGDLFYYDGSSFQNLGAGSQGQVLVQGGLNTPQWQTIDSLVPTMQVRAYTDYVRVAVSNGNPYYFGQSATGCTITPRKYNSVMQVHIELFSEPSTHNQGYTVQFSTDNGANWTNLRRSIYNQPRHGQFNAYETDYSSTPGHSSVCLYQAFSTLNPILFRIVTSGGGTTVVNGSYSSSYENAQSTITITELNADYASVTYNGGT
ncbi:MAG: hypothetical protein CMK23_05330 [Porticoccaceae bacterium]|nr:hypothetical protein [Porticoccaceae bacterium]|tara:strand:- start:9359 stop:10180 length:822 start_codon:yes stop_codon:yes gene_type:complete